MEQKTDWCAVRAEYESGAKPIRRIAADHGVSDTAVRKRATKEGWAQRSGGVDIATPQVDPVPPIDSASLADRGLALIGRMVEELDAVSQNVAAIEAFTLALEDDPRKVAAIQAAVSLPKRAETMKALAAARKTWLETAAGKAPEGVKAKRQAEASAIATGAGKFSVRRAPTIN